MTLVEVANQAATPDPSPFVCDSPPKAKFSMRRFLTDLKLYGEQFKGISWAIWCVVLIASEGEELTDQEQSIFRRVTNREHVPGVRVAELWCCVGRRGGKSRAIAAKAIYCALAFNLKPYLAPGECAVICIISATRNQSRKVYSYILGSLQSIALFRPYISNITADTITLTNQIQIQIRTADFGTIRGETVWLAIADELAYFYIEGTANPDVEILNALRPALASLHGQLCVISSPYAKRGELWNNYKKYFGNIDALWMLFCKGPSKLFNPLIDQTFLNRQFERDPMSARCEYDAEFRDDCESFVSREIIEASVVADRQQLPYSSDIAYVAFIDPAGRGQDSFCLCIAHLERNERVVIDVLLENQNQNPEIAVRQYSQVLLDYGLAECTGDRYSGHVFEQLFMRYGIRYNFSEMSKSELYSGALPLLNSGCVELPDNPKMVEQFASLERRVPRGSNKESIDHPQISGAHDDLSNVISGGILLASKNLAVLQWAEGWSRRGDIIMNDFFGTGRNRYY